jgi:MinD superfamily P-loop ATPase
VCLLVCPVNAIEFGPVVNGQWFISDTRFGSMVHAKLGVAQENSGKLVSLVRTKAREIAQQQKKSLVLIDGPPGIGCPVIASITGSNAVLVITEPTMSGLHDLERVAALTKHFGIKAMVCINKWDINPELSETIEKSVQAMGLTFVGKVRYDTDVVHAQIKGLSTVEFGHSGASQDIRNIHKSIFDGMILPSGK